MNQNAIKRIKIMESLIAQRAYNTTGFVTKVLTDLVSKDGVSFDEIETEFRNRNSKIFLIAKPMLGIREFACLNYQNQQCDFYVYVCLSSEEAQEELKEISRTAPENLENLKKSGFLIDFKALLNVLPE